VDKGGEHYEKRLLLSDNEVVRELKQIRMQMVEEGENE